MRTRKFIFCRNFGPLLLAASILAACASGALPKPPAPGAQSPRALGPPVAPTPGFHDLTLHDQGLDRTAKVYVPPGLAPNSAAAVIFCLGNSRADTCVPQGRWTEIADREGVILVGIGGAGGWNEGSGRGQSFASGIDDVAFMRRLLDSVIVAYPVDRQRVYATGFSLSGGMVLRMAVEMGDRFAAVASHSSAYWMGQHKLAAPTNVLYIVGDSDENNPMAGGGINTPKRPVSETIDAWRFNLGLAAMTPKVVAEDGVTRSTFGPARNGIEFEYILVKGLGHTWAGGPLAMERQKGVTFNATDAIWRFFESHRLAQ